MKKSKFRLQLVAEDEDESAEEVLELAVLEKDCETNLAIAGVEIVTGASAKFVA